MGIKGIVFYVAGFGLGRGLLFVSPILASNLLPLEAYGYLEWIHSLAMVGALILGFGLTATVPLIRLREGIKARWDVLNALLLSVTTMCLFLGSLFIWGIGGDVIAVGFALIGTAALLMQGFWAALFKSDGKPTFAIFIESGFWAAILIGSFSFVILDSRNIYPLIPTILSLYALTLLFFTMRAFINLPPQSFTLSDIRENLYLGAPLMATTLVTVLASSAGRLILGQQGDAELVGIYSVLYRGAALPIIVHQILIVGLFRQLFLWSDAQLKVRAPLIIWGVFACAVMFLLLLPSFGWVLGARFDDVAQSHKREVSMLLAQTILWSAIAVNDLLHSRLQIAGSVILVGGPVLAAGLALLWVATVGVSEGPAETNSVATLGKFVVGHFLVMSTYFVAQSIAAWRCGARFTLLWCSAFVLSTALFSVSFLEL